MKWRVHFLAQFAASALKSLGTGGCVQNIGGGLVVSQAACLVAMQRSVGSDLFCTHLAES